MGNQPILDCNKHCDKAVKCKFVKAVYRINCECEHWINRNQPKFDNIYDEVLSSRKDKISNKIISYQNACNHVMKFHCDDLQNGYLDKLCQHDLDNDICIMLKRNYSEKYYSNLRYIDDIKNRSNDIHQMLFFQAVDSFHEYLFHNKNDTKYMQQKRNMIENWNESYYNILTMRYVGINNQNDSNNDDYHDYDDYDDDDDDDDDDDEIDENKELTEYINGQSFIYDSNKKHKRLYVGCKYPDLQKELFNVCNLSKRQWDGFVVKSNQLTETMEIKRIRHKIDINKPISFIRILILFIYTSYDVFQKKLNELSRMTGKNGKNALNLKCAKKLQSQLGHSFKILIETVTNYGFKAPGPDNIKTVYRGLSILPLFRKYHFLCYSPCSTSTSQLAATQFAGIADNSCVLQLNVPINSIYFPMQYISIYKLESEILFYGEKSCLCVDTIHLNCCINTIHLNPMVLLENITSPSSESYDDQCQDLDPRPLIQLLLTTNHDNHDNNEYNISLRKELKYFISKKRVLLLKNSNLMRLITGNQANFVSDYINISKIIEIFVETRYITITNTYQHVNINDIATFCIENTKKTTIQSKLRRIECFHKYNKNEMNEIKNRLKNKWPLDCLWEQPFFDKQLITFKKYLVC